MSSPKSILFAKGAIVRMEYPQNAREDRLTGREFSVLTLDPPGHVIVEDDGGKYRVSTAAVAHVDREELATRKVTAEDVLGTTRRRARRRGPRR